QRQTDSYRIKDKRVDLLVSQEKLDEAGDILRGIASDYTDQFADPARKRLARIEAAKPVDTPETQPVTITKEEEKQERERDAAQALVGLKASVPGHVKAFSFDKADSLAAAAAARHAGTRSAAAMQQIGADIADARELLKRSFDAVNAGGATSLEVKYLGKKKKVAAATEAFVTLTDRSGLSLRIPWSKLDAEEIQILLSLLIDKKSPDDNLSLATLYHYRGEAGRRNIFLARAKRIGADTSRLEGMIAAAVAAPAPKPEADPEVAQPKAVAALSFSFDDAADLGRFEKVSGKWTHADGSITGTGDPASLQLFAEEISEVSGRARFARLDCKATIAAGSWSMYFDLAGGKLVCTSGGGKRQEVGFAAAANTWYDWSMKMTRR
ncbi:MAG: hypothetical protein GY844_30235, partial [Bradyrhizobium sp.]|nr:hypothetical protein [Bradyrhizobium sp.]